MSGKIAFFDFDGTITTKDTLIEFIKYAKGERAFYAGFLRHSPRLIAFKLKLLSNQSAKEHILRHFFAGMEISVFNKLCQGFSEEKLPSLIRPGALLEIQRLKDEGYRLVLVSASAENWLELWAARNGFELLATRLEIENNHITGRIKGSNCHGAEKVARIKAAYTIETFSHIAAYGDSSGDLPMLAIAHSSFFRPFR